MPNEDPKLTFSSPASALTMARTAKRIADKYQDHGLKTAADRLETQAMEELGLAPKLQP